LVITNIPWQGKIPRTQNTDGTFEQFYTLEAGIRAAALDIINDVKEHGYTLRQLITEYAPPAENNTGAYISYVSDTTGIAPDQEVVFTPIALKTVLQAVFDVENGDSADLITDAQINEGIDMLPDNVLEQIKDYVAENSISIAALLLMLFAGTMGLIYYKRHARE